MTELIWDGKYKDGKKVAPVRIPLPFQTIETVNESTEDRKKTIDLFASGKPTEWRNRLIWGDKKYVLPSLLPEFAGKVNLIYIDPPFNVGADFSYTATIPDNPETDEDETSSFVKEPSIIEQKAYRDTWGRGLDSYLQWFYESLIHLRDLLREDGCIYVHLDYHVVHYVKTLLDEVFGSENFRNEFIIKRPISKNLQAQFTDITSMSWGHDSILWYSKDIRTRFRPIYVAYDTTKPEGYWHHFWSNADRPTLRYKLLGVTPKSGQWKYNKDRALQAVRNYEEYLRHHSNLSLVEYWEQTGKTLDFIRLSKTGKVENWFPPTTEKLGDTLWTDVKAYENQKLYATQKHEDLLQRIVTQGSLEGDLLLDCFCGSGTTPAVADRMKRRWIACDLGRFAIHTTRKRLLQIEGLHPFVVQNLGKYERQAWQKAEFHHTDNRPAQERSYREFILDLYRAEPVKGFLWLHGKRGKRMVHVGAVDAPISLGDVKAIIQEFWKSVGKATDINTNGVDILGWEFAFDINETARQQAIASKVDIKFKKIPREVLEQKAVDAGDIKFFELAGLDVKTKATGKTVRLSLNDFIIPPDDVPDEVRSAITHWSQWIDYWAVDWDYKDDTFHNEWQTYRTKKEPKLLLEAKHEYESKGNYIVVIKVIDILGNDTTKAISVKVG